MSPAVDLALYVALALSLGYLIYRYARYSRWEDTDAGRAFMMMKVCLLALVLYGFAALAGMDDPWRDALRLLVVGGILVAVLYQIRVIVRNQGGFHRDQFPRDAQRDHQIDRGRC